MLLCMMTCSSIGTDCFWSIAEVLFLSSNIISGPIPEYISRLAGTLEGLYLSDNKLQGAIPTALCSLTELSKCAAWEVWANEIATVLSLSHCNSYHVGALFLDTNDLIGEIPPCLDSLTQLRQLYLFNNELSGILPEGLQDLKSLRKSLQYRCFACHRIILSDKCCSFLLVKILSQFQQEVSDLRVTLSLETSRPASANYVKTPLSIFGQIVEGTCRI